MVEARRELGLAQEAPPEPLVPCELRREHLQRDAPSRRRRPRRGRRRPSRPRRAATRCESPPGPSARTNVRRHRLLGVLRVVAPVTSHEREVLLALRRRMSSRKSSASVSSLPPPGPNPTNTTAGVGGTSQLSDRRRRALSWKRANLARLRCLPRAHARARVTRCGVPGVGVGTATNAPGGCQVFRGSTERLPRLPPRYVDPRRGALSRPVTQSSDPHPKG